MQSVTKLSAPNRDDNLMYTLQDILDTLQVAQMKGLEPTNEQPAILADLQVTVPSTWYPH